MNQEALELTFAELAHLFISPSRLILEAESELGVGGYGEVCLATLDKLSESPQKVAVKQLRIVHASGVRQRIAFRLARELKVWAKANHPNILQLIGYYLSDNYGCAQLVSAYMINGNVTQYIQRDQCSTTVRFKFVRDITDGVAYLHNFDPPICHGDLKPANVLIDDNFNAVLCDFGLASFVQESGAASGLTTSKSTKGSIRYMSPELVLEEQTKHSLESDVWAWGCTAFEIMTQSLPYSTSAKEFAIILAISNGVAPGSTEELENLAAPTDDCDGVFRSGVHSLRLLIPQCWSHDPRQRPSISSILQLIFNSTQVNDQPEEGPDEETRIQDDPIIEEETSNLELSNVTPSRREVGIVHLSAWADPSVGEVAVRGPASPLPAPALYVYECILCGEYFSRFENFLHHAHSRHGLGNGSES